MTYDKINLSTWYEMERYGSEQPSEYMRGLAQQAILEGITTDDILSMKVKDSSKLARKYDFLQYPIVGNMPSKWSGYGFYTDFANMNTGDFADLMTIAGDKELKYKLHQLIAKLWLSPESFEVKAEKILNEMSVVHATGINSFFLSYCEDLERRSLRYLAEKQRRMMKALHRDLIRS